MQFSASAGVGRCDLHGTEIVCNDQHGDRAMHAIESCGGVARVHQCMQHCNQTSLYAWPSLLETRIGALHAGVRWWCLLSLGLAMITTGSCMQHVVSLSGSCGKSALFYNGQES